MKYLSESELVVSRGVSESGHDPETKLFINGLKHQNTL